MAPAARSLGGMGEDMALSCVEFEGSFLTLGVVDRKKIANGAAESYV